ncbi:MAG: hypothetical protein AB1544_06510 [Pseudomonadota bacterium]|jgi:hypothetical protein
MEDYWYRISMKARRISRNGRPGPDAALESSRVISPFHFERAGDIRFFRSFIE